MFLQNDVKYKTLYDTLFRYRNIFTDVFMIGLSVVVLAAMANMRIPLWPVPITMQTFGLLLIAFFFGSTRGSIAILAYIGAGLLGFGVFSGYNSGLATVMGPTGGYLIGFTAMVYVVGKMIERGYGRNVRSVLLCMLVGQVVLYAFGLTGLWLVLNLPLIKLFQAGMFPFLIGDAIKAVAAALLFPTVWRAGEKIANANKE